jgi:hypothetical protein
MKLAIAAAALALAVPGLASAAQQTWKIDGDVGGFMFTLTCTLEIGDGKISGPCVSNLDPAPVATTGTYTVSGEVTSSEFSYDVKVNDMPLHVVYKGQSQPDGSVKGTVDAQGNAGTFTAKQAT